MKENEIKKTIESLTLEEKVGQLFMEYFEDKYNVPEETQEAIISGRIGSIIYFSGCNVVDGEQLAKLSAKVHSYEKKSRHKIPLILAIDQEGGQLAAIRKKAIISPGNMAIGATNNFNYAYTIGKITGAQMHAMNININLAPVVDTACNLDVPVVDNRVFGSNPSFVGKMGAAYVRGCQSEKVSACLKHFPGQSNSEKDTHFELDVIDKSLKELEKNEILPFKIGVESGADAILTIHAIYPALDKKYPATLSEKVINGYLREKLGFNGLVITDDVYMKAIKSNYGLEEAAYLAINAGVDIVMGAAGTEGMYKYIIKMVKKGKLSVDKINMALERILKFKSKYCGEIVPVEKARKVLVNKKYEELNQKTADSAITLIRNNEGILPLKLKKEEKLCIIQPGMIRLVMSDAVNLYDDNILRKEIEKRHKNTREVIIGLDPNDTEILSVLDNAFISDAVIMCSMNAYKYKGQAKLVNEIIKLCESKNKKLVTVALRSPSDLSVYPDAQTHIVTYGNWDNLTKALVKVLFGEIKPKGKLPVPIKGLYKIGYSFKGKPKKVKKKKVNKNVNYFFDMQNNK